MFSPVATISRFLAALFVLVFISSCGSNDGPSIPELIILSPHGSDIRLEFEKPFSDWHKAKYGTAVKLRWPDIGGGGTGAIINYLDPLYQKGNTSGYDMIWGGGSDAFGEFLRHGYLEKPNLPRVVLDQVPHDIFGFPLHGKDDLWVAATMSNFGIVINKQRITELALRTPKTWEDLAEPQWIDNLSLTDPSKSRSVLTSYNMICAQYGWEKGWGLLVRMFANAPLIRTSGADPGDDVGSATAVAGIVIDFYGRKQILRVGPSIVGFVIPDGGSTIDADPIAVLKGAPHAEIAAHFVEFVISPEGQRLWTFNKGTPGGPVRYVLGRMSVLPELYENESENMFQPTFPFTRAKPLKVNIQEQGYRSVFLGDLIKSALVDNHDLLVAARQAVKDAGDPPALLAEFDALPTFIPTTLDATGNLLSGSERPITSADLAAAADEFKPADKAKAVFTERLQTRLKSLWQAEFKTRLAAILHAAQARR